MASGFAPPKLAGFILTEKLGSGTYATVYKAYRKVSAAHSSSFREASLLLLFFSYTKPNSFVCGVWNRSAFN